MWTISGNGTIVGSTTGPTVTVTAGAAGTFTLTDNITRDGCPGSCTLTVTVQPCMPRIAVVKEIVCVDCGTVGCAPFTGSKTATGAKGINCPAFCYRITVRNTSEPGITLNNLSVTDDQLNLSACGFPTSLPEGGSATCTVSAVEHCATTRNIVTASAVGVLATGTSVGSVSARDTNVAVVVPLLLECTKLISVNGAAPLQNPPCLTEATNSIVYSVIVTNAGEVPIIVNLTDSTLIGLGLTMPADFPLGIGQGATITFDAVTLPCTNLENTVTVSARVNTTISTVCACDHFGNAITNSSGCSARLCCTPPGACRVTGGGKQDQTGQNANKTINVDPRANPLVAKFVTHGGQVGSPVGVATAFTPDSACIRGEWTHVRHFRPGLDGNFHARTFDSLMCACLACLGDPGSGTVVAGKHGTLCNPGDRVCGPEPRRAPDNKICFSGVGNYATTNGRRTPRSVVFRVDIEDHGEPGGSGPKGNKRLPADRYRIRIWFITGDPNSAANLALRQAVACTEANTGLRDGTTSPTAPEGVTSPLGSSFGGYVPDVDDGGELDRGNHQIHPAHMKACP